MKLVTIFFILMASLGAIANEVKVELNPAKPVAGEVFQAYFRIFTDSSDEPSVTFSPSGLEVVGKSNQGVSTRTVYANGRLTVTREITVVYDLVSPKPGQAWMRDINVNLGSKNLRHPTVGINVLREPEVAPDVFLKAEVPKTELFLGEGVVVRYFIYSKVPVQNLDVKKYPKLDNFLKRFLQDPDRTERVAVDGQVYLRSQIYAAKLFPEKIGQLKIDPLSLSATYPTTRSSDPFGSFGFNRDMKTRTINSETVLLNVKPHPVPVPSHFTGLVGKHDFELNFGQSRLIVNQPLEVRLTATGPGALESFEAPELINNPGIEQFETNGDLKIADANMASKTFDYTFLPKENVKLPSSTLALSYLDPENGKYVSQSFTIPEIEVAGNAVSKQKKSDAEPLKNEKSAKVEMPKVLTDVSAIEGSSLARFLPYLNMLLTLMALGLAFGYVYKTEKKPLVLRSKKIPASFKKDFDFGEFARWLSPLVQKTGKTPASIVKDSDLDEGTKKYFLEILNQVERGHYSSTKQTINYQYDSKNFKKLNKYIASQTHDALEQSS